MQRAVPSVRHFVLWIAIAGAMVTLSLRVSAQSGPPAPAAASDPWPEKEAAPAPQQNEVVVNLAPASGAANENAIAWRGITVNGFASLSYLYNTNNPVFRINQYRVFDYA